MTVRPIAAPLATLAAATAILLVGCSRAAQPPAATSTQAPTNPWKSYEARATYAGQHGKVVYQVQYQPATVLFDMPSTERALRKISADGATYTLDASVPATAQLKPGSVLFLYGIAIRKVTAVQPQGATVAVTTDTADVTDAISDGLIEWEVPVTFTIPAPVKQARVRRPDDLEDLLITPVFASDKWQKSFEETSQQFETTLSFGTENGLDIDLRAEYKGPGAVLEAHGEGFVQSTVAIGSLNIKAGAIDALKVVMAGLRGHADFEWQGQSLDAGIISLLNREFRIPLDHPMEQPLIIGGLPFVLECGAEMIFHPAFTSRGAVTKGRFSLDYSGSGGFTANSKGPAPEGEMHGENVIEPESEVESPNAMGFVVALEMPRFQLALAFLPPAALLEVSDTIKFQKLGALKYGKNFYKAELNELLEELEAFAQPVKPYAFVNLVLSTGIFTNGAVTSSLVYMPPCQRVQSTLSGNEGLGVRLNFAHIAKWLSELNDMTGPRVEFSPLPPFLPKKTVMRWKNDVRCPDDVK